MPCPGVKSSICRFVSRIVTPIRSDFAKPVQQDIRVFGSDILFDGSNEVGIEHAGSLYRLKITRQGKLILNK